MLSTPPAITISARPDRICSAPIAIVSKPDAQNRLIVRAGTETGNPARKLAIRAMLYPCGPSCVAHPMMTSSMVCMSRCGSLSTVPRSAAAASSSGRVFFSVPLPAFPTAVRTADTIVTLDAACIIFYLSGASLLSLRASAVLRKDRGIPHAPSRADIVR